MTEHQLRSGASLTAPPDEQLSPYTGWSRAHWEELADRLLEGVLPYRSLGGSSFDLPGPRPGGNGADMDGLEGFARTFLLAAFRIPHAQPARRQRLVDRYAAGLVTGTAPSSPHRWPAITDNGQAMVEAASIAVALWETKPWLWERLDRDQQRHIIDYLAPMASAQCTLGNWLLFRVVVLTFLESVGWTAPPGLITGLLAAVDTLYRGDGWYADGGAPGDPQLDYYSGWALNLYTVWVARAGVVGDERAGEYARRVVQHSRLLLHTVGGDGAPLHQGRSLIYRAATVAPLWAAFLSVDSGDLSPGQVRRAASGVMKHFVDHGVLGDQDVLSLGWFGPPFLPMVQNYSGPASPYWMSKGFLGLLLPPDHPVWTAPEEPLPIEVASFVRHEPVPGWTLVGVRDDGIVRMLNHGTSRDPGVRDPHSSHLVDDPHYNRCAYSTRTGPAISPEGLAPPDNWAGYLGPSGPTVRGRVRPLPGTTSASQVETLLPLDGKLIRLPAVTVHSALLDDAVELRKVTFIVTGEFDRSVTGWCVAGADQLEFAEGDSWLAVRNSLGLTSLLVDLTGHARMEWAYVPGTAMGQVAAHPLARWGEPGAARAPVQAVTLTVHLGVVDGALAEWATQKAARALELRAAGAQLDGVTR